MNEPLMPTELAELIATHRALFGGFKMVDDSADSQLSTTPATTGNSTGPHLYRETPNPGENLGKAHAYAASRYGDSKSDDLGYPADTPLAEMEPEQQAAYWRSMARKHEQRAKQAADYDQVKAERDELKQATQTDVERQITEATAKVRAETAQQFSERLAAAEFRAALAGRVNRDAATAIIEGINLTKFLASDGEVDTDMVSEHVKALLGVRQQPDMGQGNRGPSGSAKSVAAGRDLYERHHSRKD